MPLFKSVLKGINAEKKVLDYKPPKFELGTPEPAKSYIELRKIPGSDFKMHNSIRLQTGVAGIESKSVEEQVEERVLECLKEAQEGAYQEAYQLGLDEGRKEAFAQMKVQIEERLQKMDEMLTAISNLKKELVNHNESHLVQLAFHMAKRLAAAEISANPELIKDVIRQAAELAQHEEQLVIQVHPKQMEFLENLKAAQNRDFDFLKKAKFEPSEVVGMGGCIIQTNYGEIDARLEERVEKLWVAILDNIYRVKDRISAA
jgi:flagellar assembly protein FliH